MTTRLLGVAAGCGNLDSAGAAVQLRYTPDGSLVVFASDHIDVFDAQLGEQKVSIPTPPPKDWVGSRRFSLSDDGTVAAVSSTTDADNKVELFQIPSGNALSTLDLGPPPANSAGYGPEDMALSPHGDSLYVMGPVNGMSRMTGMFDTTSGALLWSSDWAIMPIFSADGGTLYVNGNHGDDLLGFDVHTGTPGLVGPLQSFVHRLGMMPDAHTVIALTSDLCSKPQLISFSTGTVVQSCPISIGFLSTDDGSTVRSFPLSPNTVFYGTSTIGLAALQCSTSAGLCAVGVATWDPVTMRAGDGIVQLWRMDGTLAQAIPDVWADDFAISPDGQFIAMTSNGDASVYRISDGARVATRHYGQSVF